MTVPKAADAAARSISEALRQLAPAHRDVLFCLHYRQWSLAETAEHLGLETDIVRSRLTFALRTLKFLLEETTSDE